MFACAKAGAILHPISWRLAPAEVAFQLDDAEPALFLIEDEIASSARRPSRSHAYARAERRRSRAAERPRLGRRPAAPDLHVRDDREAERPAHPRELLWTNLSFDLATDGPEDVVAGGPAPVSLRRLERPADPRGWKGAKIVLERGFDPRVRSS